MSTYDISRGTAVCSGPFQTPCATPTASFGSWELSSSVCRLAANLDTGWWKDLSHYQLNDSQLEAGFPYQQFGTGSCTSAKPSTLGRDCTGSMHIVLARMLWMDVLASGCTGSLNVSIGKRLLAAAGGGALAPGCAVRLVIARTH